MKFRECPISTGAVLLVPDNIQRIESGAHGSSGAWYGWQVRYGEDWPYFGDHSSERSGAEASLNEAIQELILRVHNLDAPTGLKTTISPSKANDLPPGISGPTESLKKGRKTYEYNLQVTIPRFGQKPTNRKAYIGTENTFTDARYFKALAFAVSMRNKAVAEYQEAATHARRARTPKKGPRK